MHVFKFNYTIESSPDGRTIHKVLLGLPEQVAISTPSVILVTGFEIIFDINHSVSQLEQGLNFGNF